MSLDKLPNELIAHIGSFLDFDDIVQFSLSQKRVHTTLKSYGLNKPQAERLDFITSSADGDFEESAEVKVLLNGGTNSIELATFGSQIKFGSYTLKMLDIINKFRSIDHLTISDTFLHDDAAWKTIKTKMSSLKMVEPGFWTSYKTFISFCKKFKKITFFSTSMDFSRINDVFIAEMVHNGTNVLFMSSELVFRRPKVTITDATLNTLSNETFPEELRFDSLVTEFTFGKVKKMIEDVVRSGMTRISYDFGILRQNNYLIFDEFFEDEFQDWVDDMNLPLYEKFVEVDLDEFHDKVASYIKYVIRHRDLTEEDFFIQLAVNIPGYMLREEDPDFSGDEATYD